MKDYGIHPQNVLAISADNASNMKAMVNKLNARSLEEAEELEEGGLIEFLPFNYDTLDEALFDKVS